MFLYINIPYCPEKSLQLSYQTALLKELKECMDACKGTSFGGIYMKVNHNYPDYLLLDIPGTLNKIPFSNVYNEITLELDIAMPVHIALDGLQELGINRVNLSGDLIKDYEAFVFCSEMLHDRFENISLDIQVDDYLPLTHWRSILNRLITLPVVHLSLSLGRRVGEWIINHFYLFKTIMESVGFEHYGLFHFAKPGYRSNYMNHMWNQQPFYGCGRGAQTSLGRIRWTNPVGTKEYIECALGNKASTRVLEELTDQQYALEKLMLNLRRSQGVSVEFLQNRGKRVEAQEQMRQLCSEGYLKRENDHLVLTPKGYFVEQEILRRLM